MQTRFRLWIQGEKILIKIEFSGLRRVRTFPIQTRLTSPLKLVFSGSRQRMYKCTSNIILTRSRIGNIFKSTKSSGNLHIILGRESLSIDQIQSLTITTFLFIQSDHRMKTWMNFISTLEDESDASQSSNFHKSIDFFFSLNLDQKGKNISWPEFQKYYSTDPILQSSRFSKISKNLLICSFNPNPILMPAVKGTLPTFPIFPFIMLVE